MRGEQTCTGCALVSAKPRRLRLKSRKKRKRKGGEEVRERKRVRVRVRVRVGVRVRVRVRVRVSWRVALALCRGSQNVWVAYRHQLLKVSQEQLRMATVTER